MLKTLPKILIYSFIIIFILQLASLILLLILPQPSQAGEVKFKPQVEIGEFKKSAEGIPITGKTIGEYIRAIYKYAIGIVGILATVVLMFGGILWIVAGGNAERVGNAKSWIGASLTGLILVLCSYMILKTVNPALVEFKPIYVKEVDKISIKNKICEWTEVPSGKSCDDIKGDSWISSNHSYCQGESPSLLHECCCQETEIKSRCEEECKGKGGYEYDAQTNKCICRGSGMHRECQYKGSLSGPGTYKCVTVPFAGENTCDSDNDCMQTLNCCICNYYVYKNCTSGADLTEKWCKNKCKSYIIPWEYKYTPSAICDESKNCVSQ